MALFEAFFGRTEDIGDPAVLIRLGAACGIDSVAMRVALDMHRCRERVRREHGEARTLGIGGVPAILIPDLPPIVGAVPYVELQRAMETALRRENRTQGSARS